MKIKRISAVTVSVIMAVSSAGCGKKENTETKEIKETVQKGSYVESILNSRDDLGYAGEFLKADGRILFDTMSAGPEKVSRFAMEGEDLSREDLTVTAPEDNIVINRAQTLPDGRGAVMYFPNYSSDEEGEEISGDGDTAAETEETEEADTESPAETGTDEDEPDYSVRFGVTDSSGNVTLVDIPDIMDFELTGDGKLYALNVDSELYAVDLDTGKTELLYQAVGCSYTKIDTADKYVMLSDQTEKNVLIFDTDTGDLVSGMSALNDFWAENIALSNSGAMSNSYDICEGEDGTIYLACSTGIYRYVLGGNKVEQLMDGTSTSLSAAIYNTTGPTALVYEGDDSFLVQCAAGMVRFRYDPDAEIAEQKVMKIYALEQSEALTTAINTFRRAYPNVGVELETGMTDGKTYEDAVKNLTAEIVSEDAPDVIILDGLNIHEFQDKELLADLSGSLDDLIPEEGLIENAALWNRTEDGKLYSVAGMFEIPSVACTTEDPVNFTDLKTTADAADKLKIDGQYAILMYQETCGGYMDNMIKCYGNEISDGKGSADAEKLRDFYEDCKRIYDDSYTEKLEKDMDYPLSPGIQSYMAGGDESLVPAMMCSYPLEINCLTSLKDYNDKVRYKYGTTSANSFVPKMNAAVCTKSEQPYNAKAFIKAMLTSANQSNYKNDYLAVNETAFKVNFKDRDDIFAGGPGKNPDLLGTDDYLAMDFSFTDEAEEEELMEYLNNMDTAVVFDIQTKEKIKTLGVEYLRGNITLDEAVDKASSFLSLRNKE